MWEEGEERKTTSEGICHLLLKILFLASRFTPTIPTGDELKKLHDQLRQIKDPPKNIRKPTDILFLFLCFRCL